MFEHIKNLRERKAALEGYLEAQGEQFRGAVTDEDPCNDRVPNLAALFETEAQIANVEHEIFERENPRLL